MSHNVLSRYDPRMQMESALDVLMFEDHPVNIGYPAKTNDPNHEVDKGTVTRIYDRFAHYLMDLNLETIVSIARNETKQCFTLDLTDDGRAILDGAGLTSNARTAVMSLAAQNEMRLQIINLFKDQTP